MVISRAAIMRTPAPPRTTCDVCAPLGVGVVGRDASGNVTGVAPHFARYVHSFYLRAGEAIGGRVRMRLLLVRYGSCERGEGSELIAGVLTRAALRWGRAARA